MFHGNKEEFAAHKFKKYVKSILKDFDEPHKTILKLYYSFLLNNKGKLFETVDMMQKNFEQVKNNISKFNIALDAHTIKEGFEKNGVIQLRPLISDTLLIACGENHHPKKGHFNADTIDPDLNKNPTLVGYYGDPKSIHAFLERERYHLIIDEGPLGILDTPGFSHSEEVAKNFIDMTYRLLDETDGIVVLRSLSPCCVSKMDETHHYSGIENSGFPAHLHLSPSPPERGGNPNSRYEVTEGEGLLSPKGQPFVPQYFDYDECIEMADSLKILFEKIEHVNFPYLRRGLTICFKNKTALAEQLTCPYSQCQDTFTYQPQSPTTQPKKI